MRELPRLFGKEPITGPEVERLAATAKVLSESGRIRILVELAARTEMTQTDLINALPYTQPTVAHHLRKLIAAGLVSSRKVGTWVHYSANHRAFRELSDAIRPGRGQ
jgi:ArsR family transcriptional regulator